ncbi:beta-1,4-galactosyltransferase 5-like [Mercenaria mercenaria]|uniref:beta-1,4-galactosyltransferase 5-like n=1 Tax=Mercenaria mercenaria TaxID=6596 RepID=UPI00234F0A2C|nr:beta-1,4-galactosyltransferase 5-like [Mercenaria mercenaria]
MPYDTYFGGVNAFSKEQFTLVNGFPNLYFGWGYEDDDVYHRVLNANLSVQRLSYDVGRYRHLGHRHSILGNGILKLYNTKQQRYLSDGLNNLKYKRISYNLRPLCTWISIGLYNHTGQVMQEVSNGE